MFWWYLVQLKPCVLPKGIPICQKQTQYAALWLCEQVVQLWRLACLNPELRLQNISQVTGRFPSGSSVISVGSNKDASICPSSPTGCWLLQQLNRRLKAFHLFALEQAGVNLSQERDPKEQTVETSISAQSKTGQDYLRFVGFKPALAACWWVVINFCLRPIKMFLIAVNLFYTVRRSMDIDLRFPSEMVWFVLCLWCLCHCRLPNDITR